MGADLPILTALNGALRIPIPGRLGPGQIANALIFAASSEVDTGLLLRRFFAEEFDALDWVDDFALDRELALMTEAVFGEGTTDEADEMEDPYVKAAVVDAPADSGWADG